MEGIKKKGQLHALGDGGLPPEPGEIAVNDTIGNINEIWACIVVSIIVFSNAEFSDAISFMHENYLILMKYILKY